MVLSGWATTMGENQFPDVALDQHGLLDSGEKSCLRFIPSVQVCPFQQELLLKRVPVQKIVWNIGTRL